MPKYEVVRTNSDGKRTYEYYPIWGKNEKDVYKKIARDWNRRAKGMFRHTLFSVTRL